MRIPAPLPDRLRSLAVIVPLVCAVAAHPAGAAAEASRTTPDQVRRVLTLLTAVGEEYREGVRDGQIVRPVEWEEAQTFLLDAAQAFDRISGDFPHATPEIKSLFDAATVALKERVAPEDLAVDLVTLRERVAKLTGVTEQVYPAQRPSAARGGVLYAEHCATCHGERGDGTGPAAVGLQPPPANFTDAEFMRGETPSDFYHVISLGKPRTAMPAWDGVLSVQERWDVVSYLWTLAPGTIGLPEGQGSTTGSDTDVNLEESARLLDAALAAYDRGDEQASALAADAYMQFEPLEPRIGATHPSLKSRIEERFLHVRQLLRAPGHQVELRNTATALHADLTAARDALQPRANRYALFLEAVTIILREGLEIVLVVGALIAYVSAAGHVAMLRSIYVGTSLGVAASLVTALLIGELLHLHAGAADLLEGVTMLLAAVVLFWVSYWLISKTEAARWHRYIRGKVENAVGRRRTLALAGAAFLAVYREGFETVLFYQALYASAPAATLSITAGLATGGAALALVYIGLRRFQVQIPIRQFFFWTGLFLYAMAAVFAGQGVHELQEAGLVAMIPLRWVPTAPLLGLYPSVQTVAAQGVFAVLLIYATILTVRRRRHAATVETAHLETAPVRP